ncbi:MAG TPA: carboxypeptidase-like regulatory domain-containing protein [Terriglobia bacterium]
MRDRSLRSCAFALGALLIPLLLATRLPAQTSGGSSGASGVVRGQVTDPSGAAVTDVTVVAAPTNAVTGQTKAAVVNKDGSYEIKGLIPGQYTVSAVAKGFAPFEQESVQVVAGHAQRLDIALKIEQERQQVDVSSEATTVSVDPGSNATATVLKGKDLDALSDDPDELQDELEALAGPSAGPNGGQIYIDGFTAGQLPPKSAILEVRVNQNPFSAEYDKLGYGRIEITTKPGLSQYHGQFFVNGNSSAFNSRSPFVTEEPGYHSEMYSGNIGGPINKKASFFFSIFDRQNNDSSIINAVVLSPDLTSQVPYTQAVANPRARLNLSPRIDYQLTPTNVMTFRYQLWRDSEINEGLGQFSLPSQGYNSNGTEQTIQISDTQVVSARTVNQVRFQYRHETNLDIAQNLDPAIAVLGAFTGGGNTIYKTQDTQDNYELQNLTSIALGKHSLAFGGRLRDEQDSNLSESNFNGQFTFSSLNDYQTAEQALQQCTDSGLIGCEVSGASQFLIATGIPLAKVNLFDAGLYTQDDWRMRPNMTLSLGLRWEAQNDINDHSDFAPRLGFAWGISRGKSVPKTVLRAGFGIFYDRFQEQQVLQAERFNGMNQQQYLVNSPDFYPNIPPTSILASNLSAPTIYQISPDLRAPYTIQSAIGLERQVTKNATVSVTYLNSRGVHQFLTNDINAPLPGTYPLGDPSAGTRPFPDQGNIYQYQSVGEFNQNQLIANFNIRLGSKLSLFGFYTLNYANSDTGGVNTSPMNPYDILEDYGRAAFDVRNRLFMGGNWTLPHGFSISPFMVANSGAPFNITTGLDQYGTALFNARPSLVPPDTMGPNIVSTSLGTFNTLPAVEEAIISPNYGDGPSAFTLNLRLSKTFGFGKATRGSGSQRGYGGPGGGGGRGPGGGLGPRGLSGGGGGNVFGPGTGENHRYNLTFSVQARNVFNNVNLGPPIGVLNSPLFGQSNSLAGGPFSSQAANRQINLQAMFSF